MEEKNVPKKTVNSFALLQQKMNEVQKSKKPTEAPPSSKSNDNNKSQSSKPSNSSFSRTTDRNKKSPPRQKENPPAKKVNLDPNVPDRSFGDYFCPICDSHMNSDAMWEAHITGKRHIKNIKKGDTDSKYEDLDVDSHVKYEIRNIKDPVVGLSYIHEIRRKEAGAPPLYTCFLCQATFATVQLVIEHVLTLKHRMNYMKENSPGDYELLEATNLKKGQLEPLVAEVALKLEQQNGRGSVKVKQEKNKPVALPGSRRMYDSDDDDLPPKKSRNLRQDEDFYGSSKSNDYSKRDSYALKDNRDTFRDSRDTYRDSRDAFRDSRDTFKDNRDTFKDNRDTFKDNRDTFKDSRDTFKDSRDTFKDSRDSFRDNRDSYRDSVKDCRDILNEKRRHAYSAEEDNIRSSDYEFDRKGSHFSRSPTRDSPLDRYSHSKSPPRLSYARDPYGPKLPFSPALEPPVRSRDPYGPKLPYSPVIEPPNRPYLAQDSSRGSETCQSSSDARGSAERPSSSSVLKDFVEKIYALPSEIFLKIVLLKLDSMDIKGINELQMLTKIINKAQDVFYTKLPEDVQAVIKQAPEQKEPAASNSSALKMPAPFLSQMSNAAAMFSSSTNLNPSRSLPPTQDFNFIKDFLSKARADSSALGGNQNVGRHPNNMSFPSPSSYNALNYNTSYQNDNPSTSSSGIPGLTLTEENRDSKASYNTFQPQYSTPHPTFSNAPPLNPPPNFPNSRPPFNSPPNFPNSAPSYNSTPNISNPPPTFNNPLPNVSNPAYNNPLPNISMSSTAYNSSKARYTNPSSRYN